MKSRRQPTIEVTVSPTGAIRIEADGYDGSTCEEATRFLEQALGLPGRRTRKAGFFRRRQRNVNQQKLEP